MSDYESFLSPGEVAELETVAGQAYATLQAWEDPDPIMFYRQDGTQRGAFTPVSIVIAGRQEQAVGTVAASTEQSGEVLFWTDDLATTPLHQGDRFTWNGQPCQITVGPADEPGGITAYGFEIGTRNVTTWPL